MCFFIVTSTLCICSNWWIVPNQNNLFRPKVSTKNLLRVRGGSMCVVCNSRGLLFQLTNVMDMILIERKSRQSIWHALRYNDIL